VGWHPEADGIAAQVAADPALSGGVVRRTLIGGYVDREGLMVNADLDVGGTRIALAVSRHRAKVASRAPPSDLVGPQVPVGAGH
jgi:hypothetical protein